LLEVPVPAVCPILTNGTNAINCIEHNCAFWDATYGQCGMIAGPHRITAAFEQLQQAINEIKVKI
jgi:hypothetical protein